MSDGSSKMKASLGRGLLLLCVAVALVAPVAAWCLSRWLATPEPYRPTKPWPEVSVWDAQSIAIAEVKKKEGWSGIAEAENEANEWWVTVYRDFEHRKSNPESRVVSVNIHDGHIGAYIRRPEK